MKILIVEGRSDLKLILGILGIKNLEKHRCQNIRKIRCYTTRGCNTTLVCEGGGKDRICQLAQELHEEAGDAEIHILLDGDARGTNCGGPFNVHYLDEKNIDELVYSELLKNINLTDAERQLALQETDSRAKAYLAMYLAWKHRQELTYEGDYWTCIHDLYHTAGLKLDSLKKRPDLSQILNLIEPEIK